MAMISERNNLTMARMALPMVSSTLLQVAILPPRWLVKPMPNVSRHPT